MFGKCPDFASILELIILIFKRWHLGCVKDKEVADKLLPRYELGCKRITPSDTYLKAYNNPNVHLITDKIEKLTEKGVKTEKQEHEFDVILMATGFDVEQSFKGSYTTFGKDKKLSLQDEWGDSPSAFAGTIYVSNSFFSASVAGCLK